MSEYKCPHCTAIWSYAEYEWGVCDACGYMTVDSPFLEVYEPDAQDEPGTDFVPLDIDDYNEPGLD